MKARIFFILLALVMTSACDGALSTGSDLETDLAAPASEPSLAETPDESAEPGGSSEADNPGIETNMIDAEAEAFMLGDAPPKDTDGTGCRGKGKWACPTEPTTTPTEPTAPTEPTEPTETCGNGTIDEGETCDGNCPTSCGAPNSCTTATLIGDSKLCNAACVYDEITACVDGDGCCASGCSYDTDNDCPQPTTTTGTLDCTDDSTWPQAWKDYENEALRLINERRAQGADCGYYGAKDPVGPMQMSSSMLQATRCHSLDMDLNNYRDHYSLDGRFFTTRLYDAGYTGSPRVENIVSNKTSAQELVTYMFNSDCYCRSLMRSDTDFAGIGYSNVNGAMTTVNLGAGN